MTKEQVIDWWREKEPGKWVGVSDDQLYESIQKRFGLSDYKAEETKEKDEVFNPNANINEINPNPGLISKLVTFGLSDAFAEEGGLGWNADFWKETYNKSLAGVMWHAIHGEQKYQDVDYDESWWEGAMQFFFGMASPVEIAAFAAGGLLGGVAKAGVGSISNKLLSTGIKEGTKKKLGEYPGRVLLHKTLTGATELGVSGSAYAAAHGATQEAANQRVMGETTIDMSKVMLAGADTFMKSLPLFAITGGVVKGLSGTGYAYAKYLGGKDPSFINKASRLLTNPVSQVTQEAGLFTTLPSMLPEVLGGDEHAPAIGTDEWWHEFGKNMGIMGGLRVFNKFAERKLKGDKDVLDFMLTEFDILAASEKRKTEAKDRISDSLPDGIIKRELVDKMVNERLVDSFVGQDKKQLKKDFKTVRDFQKKLENDKFVENLKNGDPEATRQAGEAARAQNKIMLLGQGMLSEVLKNGNEPLLHERFEALYGRKPVFNKEGKSSELEQFKNILKTWSDIQSESFDRFNEAARGDMGNSDIIQTHPSTDPKYTDTPKQRTTSQIKKAKEVDLVNELAAFLGKDPSDIRASKDYSTGIIEKREGGKDLYFMSTEKLEKAIEAHKKTQLKEGDPVYKLSEARKELKDKDIIATRELETRRKVKEGGWGELTDGTEKKKVIDYAKEKLGEGSEQYIDFIIGSKKFMFDKKIAPGNRKKLIDYIAWLKDNGFKVTDATSELTRAYIEFRGKTGKDNKPWRDNFNSKVISAFFGSGREAKVTHRVSGFSNEYMDNRTVSVLGDRGGRKATKEQIGVAEPKEYKKIKLVKKNLFEKIVSKAKKIVRTYLGPKGKEIEATIYIENGKIRFTKDRLKKDGTEKKLLVEYDVNTIDVATEMLYEFGARGIDTLERLRVKDINWKDGIITTFQAGEGRTKKGVDRLEVPIKEVFPELWKKIEKLKGNRKSDSSESIFVTTKGKGITRDHINKVMEAILPADIKLLGEKGKITVQDFRRMAETDARGSRFESFVDEYLVAHRGDTKRTYVHVDAVKEWREWVEYRKGLGEVKEPIVTEAPKVKADITGTKAEKIEHWKQTVESIKRDIKTEKDRLQIEYDKGNIPTKYSGTLENLQSQLKGAGFQLSSAKKAKERVGGWFRDIIFKTKGDKAKRDKFIDKAMFLNKLSESDLKRVGLDKGVLGEFAEGVIRLQKGEWQPADFYHENMHRLKALAKATGDTKMLKLIGRGERLAKDTKAFKEWKKKPGNKNRDMEEFFSDVVGGKASRLEFSKGLYNKISQFVKQMVSTLKVKFGVGNFNDLSRYFAKKVQKGFETEGVTFAKEPVKYRTTGEVEAPASASVILETQSMLSEFFKGKGTVNAAEKAAVKKHIARAGGLSEDFKISSKSTNFEINAFRSALLQIDKNVGKNWDLVKTVKFMGKWSNSEKLRIDRNVTEQKQREILESYGVKDGNIFKANENQMDAYISLLNEMRSYNQRTSNWIDDVVKDANITMDMKHRFKIMADLRRATTPLHSVLQAMGLGKLSRRLITHSGAEAGHLARGIITFQENAKAILGGNKFDKIKDFIVLLDRKRYLEHKKEGTLPKGAEAFINSALDSNWKPKKVGNKYTRNAEIAVEYKKMTDYYKQMTKDVLKQVMSEAEYEKFIKDGNLKFIEDGFYVSRVLTAEFKEKIYNPKSEVFKKIIDKNATKIAIKMAEYEGFKNPTKEQIAKHMEQAVSVAEAELQNAFNFNPGKYSTNFLKERGPKLKEFYLDANGKRIQTYEMSYDKTIAAYSNGMSKFLANVEFFPEHVNLSGFKAVGLKTQIGKLKNIDTNLGEWVNEKVNDHLGISQGAEPYKKTTQIIRRYTGVLAKLQLSFPLSGLKNLILGTNSTMVGFKIRDFLMGVVHSLDKDNRKLVRSTGATELGMRHFTETGYQKAIDKYIFKFGLMKRSENINRYISVLASKNEQLRLAKTLRYKSSTSAAYRKARTRLTEFYQLGEKEISTLKKYGMEGVEGHTFKNAYEKGRVTRELDVLYQKMNHLAHINTQGASIDLFMPEWTSKPIFKSALLYKRMAYASTVNTMRNLRISFKNGNMIPTIMFGLGAYVGGSSLIYLYDKLLGQPMPKEKSEWTNQLMTILWKGEFMGILSEFLSPFNRNGIGPTMYPAIWTNLALLGHAVQSLPGVGTWLGGTKGDRYWVGGTAGISAGKLPSQVIHDITRGSVGLYNGVSKMVNRGMLAKDSYVKESMRYDQLYRDYEGWMSKNNIVFEGNEGQMLEFKKSAYMRAFKDVFRAGTQEDIAKWYVVSLLAKANDFYQKAIGPDTSGKMGQITDFAGAFKAARTSMKTSVTNLNPNQAAMSTKKSKKQRTKKSIQFLRWLGRRDFDKLKRANPKMSDKQIWTQVFKTSKDVKKLIKLQKQYDYKVRKLNEMLPEYMTKAQIAKLLKSYNIPIHSMLK